MSTLVNKIDTILPQTQCRECTYQDCLSYAKAIVNGDRIDRCRPGGIEVLEEIAKLVGKDSSTYKTYVQNNQTNPKILTIQEENCIGCTKCIKACPVDAIVGAAKKMHTIIQQECTGCNLCIPVCPVDCIKTTNEPPKYDKEKAKQRYIYKIKRQKQPDPIYNQISNSDKNAVNAKQEYIKKLMNKKNA